MFNPIRGWISIPYLPPRFTGGYSCLSPSGFEVLALGEWRFVFIFFKAFVFHSDFVPLKHKKVLAPGENLSRTLSGGFR